MNSTALRSIELPNSTPVTISGEKIAVIGLGYVGLPLAVTLASNFKHVVGYDINQKRVTDLLLGIDTTDEVTSGQLAETKMKFTSNSRDLSEATAYIVTVPTPIDDFQNPDLGPLRAASALVGQYLNKGDLVVYESTVYPGVTENVCGPILAEVSGLRMGEDFALGYSPERINPGDKDNPVSSITKLVSGDSPATTKRVAEIYSGSIEAGLHLCECIKVAEAAKVLENTQRDVNIALMNEVSMICDRIGIETTDVIKAASTKWNFLPFTPGLVGGHCIGVDPYYLAALARNQGISPDVILSGRRVNNAVIEHIKNKVLEEFPLLERAPKVAILGLTFKEDVPDVRNSKSLDLYRLLTSLSIKVEAVDEVVQRAGLDIGAPLRSLESLNNIDVLILAVPHEGVINRLDFSKILTPNALVLDIKSAIPRSIRSNKYRYWSL